MIIGSETLLLDANAPLEGTPHMYGGSFTSSEFEESGPKKTFKTSIQSILSKQFTQFVFIKKAILKGLFTQSVSINAVTTLR